MNSPTRRPSSVAGSDPSRAGSVRDAKSSTVRSNSRMRRSMKAYCRTTFIPMTPISIACRNRPRVRAGDDTVGDSSPTPTNASKLDASASPNGASRITAWMFVRL